MVRTLKLKNFKGIKEGELKLYPFTILIGSNNSAKTTVLEALFLLPDPLRDFLGQTSFSIVRNSHMLMESQLGSSFLFNGYTSREASIALDDNELKMYRDKNNVTFFSNSSIAGVPKQGVIIDGNKIVDSWLGYVDVMGNPHHYYISQHGETFLFNSYVLRHAFQWFMNHWIELANTDLPSKVAEELSNFSHEKYLNFTMEPFLANVYTMYALTAEGMRVRISDLGEGMQIYVAIRLLYSLLNPKLVLWDDIEAHLNPRMLFSVAGWLSEISSSGVNVVVTTHSLEAVKALAEAAGDAQIILLSLEKGKLKSREMRLSEVEELQKAGIDVRLAEGFLI